ncbi:MAG: hypothetical protein UV73_C0001G0051 [Candidatus Gottesmanbacteria bacterium GW2011_GWA2_43_14]|uniref:Restriction endonuclease type IV Mrr domain-containing protein n=1 Tax=Candidatus Gottesmanbacteria bacterium GW2011_GWA2_43_14 TaxID=1618443 RepID=A0A0G1DKZ6_9BACT|nr:MAG: hypothetical protein UV73_C0001G0051 [Candidatus Gottesmanbacteria bacterium GW2011_GWA2_43_14]
MNNQLTATHHTLDFNLLPPDKFAQIGHWLAEDTGEYRTVDYYEGSGDKGRDVIGITHDEDLDYFQCKKYKDITFGVLKTELDKIAGYIKTGEIDRPRRICFVISSPASPDARDKAKAYAQSVDLPTPDFWGPVVLDKKVKTNNQALKNFFNISEEEEHLPQIDVDGLIAGSNQETRFTIINTGDVPAIECSWEIKGFAWGSYPGQPKNFTLAPQEKKELRIAMEHDFMKKNQIRELRLHFEFRNGKGSWFFSERLFKIQLVPSQAFYRIHPEPGDYIAVQPLTKFTIDEIESRPPTGLNVTTSVKYTFQKETRYLEIQVSRTLQEGIWRFSTDELNYALKELAERKIFQMIRTGDFEDKFVVNSYLKPTQETGFEAYKELRDSI